MPWVKVGRWVFQTDEVAALEHRVDGISVKLKGGHEVRLNRVESQAFLIRFEQGVAIEDLGVVQESVSDKS
jgi:hypothetical protein